nr:unnamed protein product [Callosobruchus chinensis]
MGNISTLPSHHPFHLVLGESLAEQLQCYMSLKIFLELLTRSCQSLSLGKVYMCSGFAFGRTPKYYFRVTSLCIIYFKF